MPSSLGVPTRPLGCSTATTRPQSDVDTWPCVAVPPSVDTWPCRVLADTLALQALVAQLLGPPLPDPEAALPRVALTAAVCVYVSAAARLADALADALLAQVTSASGGAASSRHVSGCPPGTCSQLTSRRLAARQPPRLRGGKGPPMLARLPLPPRRAAGPRLVLLVVAAPCPAPALSVSQPDSSPYL